MKNINPHVHDFSSLHWEIIQYKNVRTVPASKETLINEKLLGPMLPFEKKAYSLYLDYIDEYEKEKMRNTKKKSKAEKLRQIFYKAGIALDFCRLSINSRFSDSTLDPEIVFLFRPGWNIFIGISKNPLLEPFRARKIRQGSFHWN